MASLPSPVITSNSLKLEADFSKPSPSSLSLQKRNSGIPDFREALSAINDGFVTDSKIYLPLLHKCIYNNSISDTQLIHGHTIKNCMHNDIYLMTFLVNAYGKCGSMTDARKLFDKMPKRNVVTWTSLMTGYVQNSQPELAVRVFLEMLESGSYPTHLTLAAVLNACNLIPDIRLGVQIHGYIVKYGVEDDTSVGNSLCNMYSKGRDLESAIKVNRRIAERDVISYTTVISSCGDNFDSAMGLTFFSEMLSEGIQPNEFTMTNILSLCGLMEDASLGSQVHSMSVKLGFLSYLPVRNAIMHLYLKCGQISEARKLFDGIEIGSLVTWNTMISGHGQMMGLGDKRISAYNNGIEALNLFSRLKRTDIKPDPFTFSCLFRVCSGLVALEQGEQVHAESIKSGYMADVVVGSSLINMYNKCGNIENATKAFVEMPTRTLISWTSMIAAFARHGLTQQALQLFEDMRFTGLKPNRVTFVAVLSACGLAGMVDDALAYFEMMKNEYNMNPMMDHYQCLIDMFVRLGRLDDAFDVVKKMEFEPSELIWSLLVAGCISHGNLDLGLNAAEKLLTLNPKDSETYVLLLDMYVSAGRWDDISKVRKMMSDNKIGKLVDWSCITIKGKVHSYKPDDKSSPPCVEVEKLLGDLLEKAKTFGYEWQGIPEVTKEDDEEITFSAVHHSEKLTIAFGLLNISNGAPIQVFKSICMCRDCHNFIKFVSVLTARQIIIQDSKSLHKFANGKCACGDFSFLL